MVAQARIEIGAVATAQQYGIPALDVNRYLALDHVEPLVLPMVDMPRSTLKTLVGFQK